MKATETKRLAFSKRSLLAIKPPKDNEGRVSVYDTVVRGLSLVVTANGVKSFYLYRRVNGRPTRLQIGEFPEVTVEIARKRAQKEIGDQASGIDIAARKRAKRNELTLNDAWEHWQSVRSGKRSFAIDKRVWERDLKRWASRPLSKLTRAEVVALHVRLGRDFGPCSGNRMLALLRAMLNKAIDDLAWAGVNPCTRIPKHAEPPRERFVQPDEMPALFKAIAAEPCETSRDFVLLLLLTGQRKSVVLRMRWADVDLQNQVWHVPGEWQKNGRPLTVPLDPSVIAVLTRRAESRNGCAWVLPSPADHEQPLRQPRHLWERIRSHSGLADVRPHDLRRTFASYLAMSGAGLSIVGAALGHRSIASTMVYNRLTTSTVREAAGKGIEAIAAASGGLLALKPTTKPSKKTAKRKQGGEHGEA